MGNYILCITIGIAAVLVAVIAAMRIRYRRILKEKDDGIFRRICEQKRLEEELEHTRIARETLKEALSAKLSDTPQPPEALEKEITLLVKARKVENDFLLTL
jgi:hypothetical protein